MGLTYDGRELLMGMVSGLMVVFCILSTVSLLGLGVEALVRRVRGRVLSGLACRSFADAVSEGDLDRAEAIAAMTLRGRGSAGTTGHPPEPRTMEGEPR